MTAHEEVPTLPFTSWMHREWWGALYELSKFQSQHCDCAVISTKRCAFCKPLGDRFDKAEQALRSAGEW